ncbi:6-phosphogluconolactonase, cycloisomerase 2 family [Ralstonia sp. 25mfcol4.1]|uniref:hypothetical protein n=1 Tax=Ralstonia sp. 25mfcol4.1 TaxID=1761899 RepID=UPI00088C9216|nr:hypothetical protein [Ralstonia sp. 25mfcol4.1]SDP77753.1 6-phosphogluconolactonase, cycloisomerase 2 family [Ralstonia sp. 25mfcol4.1]
MFPHALAGARAAGLALLTAALLAACGSDDSPPTPAATPAASRLVVDTGSAAPVAGGTLTLKATLLAADGSELKGASFAWTSSDPTVATVVSAADKAPAAVSASVMAAAPTTVGTYATVQTLAAGAADITATATLADGSRITSVTHLVVQAAPAKSYTLVLSPATVAVSAGGAAQTVTVAVRRSDGVDGVADLTHWSWTSDDASFVATPAADGRSAQVASPNSATAAGAATLTTCADAPAGGRLCANAALTRNAALPPTYRVGGTVSGLATGKSLQLADTNGDTQVISANGGFTLPTPRQAASSYAVTVAAQPAGQTCTVANGAGTVAAANVAGIVITCVQAQFVVVANSATNTLAVYRADPASGALTAVPGSPFAGGDSFSDIAFLQNGMVGYATMPSQNAIARFQLDPSTGALSRVQGGDAASLWTLPQTIAISGQNVLVGTQGGVAAYRADPVTFGLSATGGAIFVGGGQTLRVALAASGRNIYAANASEGDIDLFAFDPNATYASVPLGQKFASGVTRPTSLAITPDGRSLLYASTVDNLLGIANIDPTTDRLLAVTTLPSSAGGPVDVVITPSGQYAYVLGSANGSIVGYQLSGGTVAPMANSWLGGQNEGRMRIDSGGRFLYSASFNGLLTGYVIDNNTGSLTPMPGSPFPSMQGNSAIAIVEPKP